MNKFYVLHLIQFNIKIWQEKSLYKLTKLIKL